MQRTMVFSLLVLLLAISACSPLSLVLGGNPTAASAPTLTADLLRNASYSIRRMDGTWQTCTLTDGTFQSGNDPASPDYVNLSLGEGMAFGDLNNDGVGDAAVILGANYGGSGVFVSIVAMLNQDGTPVFTASRVIDDRANVHEISIVNGEILASVDMHGPLDAMCCPTLPTVQTYRLVSGQLILRRFTSSPGGLERIITIVSPAEGDQVTNPFTITGSVTVAPFENTLGYRIVLPDGTVVVESSLMVDAPDMGQPGTFSLPLDLSNAGITGPIRIEVFETSAADGSLVALASVNLVIP